MSELEMSESGIEEVVEAVETEETPVVETEETVDTEEVKETEESTEADEVETPEVDPLKDNKTMKHMRHTIKALQKKVAELQTKPEPEPELDRDNFDSDADYIDAIVDRKVKAIIPQQQTPDPYTEKVQKARETHPDFDAVMDDVSHINFTDEQAKALKQAVSSLSHGDELMYNLAKSDELEEIALLPPAVFAARLGEIHAGIKSAKKQPNPPRKSNAPAPVKPVKPVAKVTKSYDDMTDEEFYRTRDKEVSERRLF